MPKTMNKIPVIKKAIKTINLFNFDLNILITSYHLIGKIWSHKGLDDAGCYQNKEWHKKTII